MRKDKKNLLTNTNESRKGFFAKSKGPTSRTLLTGFLLTVFLILALFGSVNLSGGLPHVYASSEPTYCSTIGGSWDGTTNLCTFSGQYYFSGALEITTGTTLNITFSGCDLAHCLGIGLYIGFGGTGTLQVDSGATLVVENSGGYNDLDGIYISSSGTINNMGTITVDNGVDTFGVTNSCGSITNSGTIKIENGGAISNGGYDFQCGTITNSGTIIVQSSVVDIGVPIKGFSAGFSNYATFTNMGTVDVENTAGTGVASLVGSSGFGGTINNYATIAVDNSGGTGVGSFGTFNNYGTITITSSGSISMSDTFNNYGTVNVENTAGIGIYNSGGGFNNYGTVNVENTAGTGIKERVYNFNNYAEVYNAGLINDTGYGFWNESCSAYYAQTGTFIGSRTTGSSCTSTSIHLLCTPTAADSGYAIACSANVQSYSTTISTGIVIWTQTGTGSFDLSSSICQLAPNGGGCTIDLTAANKGSVDLTVSYYGNLTYYASKSSASLTVLTPNLSINPTEGPTGSFILLSGSDYEPSTTYVFCYEPDTSTPAFCSSSTFQFTTDSSGNIPSGFGTLDLASGSSNGLVVVSDTYTREVVTSAEFTITTPSISVSPASGAVGTQVSVTGSGFSEDMPIGYFTFDGNTPSMQSCTSQTTSSTGTFTCTFIAPTSSSHENTITASGYDANQILFQVPSDTASTTFALQSDFSIIASPANPIFDAGYSSSSTISLNNIGGFTGTVLLTVSAPSGITASLSSGSISGSGTSILSLSSSTAGTYTVTVTGTSGTLIKTAQLTVTVDSVPSISLAFTPNGNNGWFTTSQASGTVSASAASGETISSFSCTVDSTPVTVSGLTGIGTSSASGSVAVSGDGSHSVSCTATDSSSGSSNPATATVKIDTIAPTISLAVPTPNGNNGWFISSPVSITITASDGGSGLVTPVVCTDGTVSGSSLSISGDGIHTFTCTAKDNAGNSATTTSTTVKIETTPPASPSISLSPSVPNGMNGWYTGSVSFTVTPPPDTISGSVTCTAIPDYSGPDSATAQSSSTVCTDPAGLSVTASSAQFMFESTGPGAPTVTLSPTTPNGQNGWYVGSVSFIITPPSETTSGSVACTPIPTFTGPDGVGLSFSSSCTDAAGLTGPLGNSPAFNFEAVALTVTVSPVTIDSGQMATLTAQASGGTGTGYTFAWYSGSSCSGSSLGTSSSYTTATLTADTTYCVLVTDSLGATASSTVTVTVLTPSQEVQQLTGSVAKLGLSHGQTNSLDSQLNSALNSISRGNIHAADGQLTAFVNQLNALVNSGRLTQAQAAPLISQALAIEASLGS